MDNFVNKQRALLQLEKDWEWQANSSLLLQISNSQLQRIGKALLNLGISSHFTGLGGKIHVEFTSQVSSSLPPTKIRNGDVVRIESGGKEECSGIVTQITSSQITVCLHHAESEIGQLLQSRDRYRLIQMPNEISFKRYFQTLNELESSDELLLVKDSFFVQQPCNSCPSLSLKFYNASLDTSQQAAVNHALITKPLALIHGPPGTGKTMTLIEVILQLLRPTVRMNVERMKSERILVCGPSNISVDNLIERMEPYASNLEIQMIRIGHPARVLSKTLPYSLESQIISSGNGEILSDLKKEINQLVEKLFFNKSTKKLTSKERREQLELLKFLRKDLKEREKKVTGELMFSQSKSTIVFSTLTGVGSKLFKSESKNNSFDYVIIDEATQALEVECWMAMKKATKSVILAGDHHQLPPTVTCPEAVERGLEKSCFDRIQRKNPHLIKMLNIQYRMNEKIMRFPSNRFYNGNLQCAPNVASITLLDILNNNSAYYNPESCSVIKNDVIESTVLTEKLASISIESICKQDLSEYLVPLILIDTQYCANPNETEEINTGFLQDSKKNDTEAKIAVERVLLLIEKLHIKNEQVAIISPYSAQVSLINELLNEKGIKIEVGTVDGFQGREKEVIIFSAVRSNDKREIGFLSDYRRLNVAITRAKRQLIFIGDCQTLCADELFKKLICYFEEEGYVEYPSDY